jgi:putative acetyltransferase
MAEMSRAEALAFWDRVAGGVERGERILLAAERDGRLVGTVQVVASGIPNQPHRSDLSKMLVHRRARGRGIGAALLREAEAHSRDAGWWLMVLDTVVGSEGDRLYGRGGWIPVGVIPNFALFPDGALCGTRYFYKDLRPAAPIAIARETPDQPEILALIRAADAHSAGLYPAESNHGLPLAALLRPEIRFLVARRGGAALGCGALKIEADGTGELKRFFVDPAARGLGVGSRLVAAVEAEARREGLRLLRLETGVYSAAAIALYRGNGFRPREAFAPYAPDPLSVFMEKTL